MKLNLGGLKYTTVTKKDIEKLKQIENSLQSFQNLVSQLVCGEILHIKGDECLNSNGQSVLKFSKRLIEKIEEMKSKHYKLKSVNVNFILYWLKEGSSQEIKIILSELYFEAIE